MWSIPISDSRRFSFYQIWKCRLLQIHVHWHDKVQLGPHQSQSCLEWDISEPKMHVRLDIFRQLIHFIYISFLLRASWKISLFAKRCNPRKIKTLLTCLLTYFLYLSGSESKVTSGVLDIQVELFPKTKQTLSDEVITAQIQLERERHAKQERLFIVYTKQWWKEYLSIREIHQDRLVKIFAQVRLHNLYSMLLIMAVSTNGPR